MASTGGDDPQGWRDKLDRFSTWRAELSEEAVLLPQTLADLRTTIQDLRKVSSRLEHATQGIETALQLAESSGIAPLARQLDTAATEMETQVRAIHDQMPGSQLMKQTVADLQKTLDTVRSLLPRPRPDR
jgi:hypothetical protein